MQTPLLGKGLTFSPAASYDNFTALKDLHLFALKLIFKKWFHRGAEDPMLDTQGDQEIVRILEELLVENEGEQIDTGRVPDCICKKNFKVPYIGSVSSS